MSSVRSEKVRSWLLIKNTCMITILISAGNFTFWAISLIFRDMWFYVFSICVYMKILFKIRRTLDSYNYKLDAHKLILMSDIIAR